METKLQKLNALYEKHKNKTEGLFHNTLWQLMVNNVRKGMLSAFVYIYGQPKDRVNVGIADYGHKGYTPATFKIKETVGENERELMIDELNSVVFGITPEKSFEIEISSYSGT
jgi:hypothetical protein